MRKTLLNLFIFKIIILVAASLAFAQAGGSDMLNETDGTFVEEDMPEDLGGPEVSVFSMVSSNLFPDKIIRYNVDTQLSDVEKDVLWEAPTRSLGGIKTSSDGQNNMAILTTKKLLPVLITLPNNNINLKEVVELDLPLEPPWLVLDYDVTIMGINGDVIPAMAFAYMSYDGTELLHGIMLATFENGEIKTKEIATHTEPITAVGISKLGFISYATTNKQSICNIYRAQFDLTKPNWPITISRIEQETGGSYISSFRYNWLSVTYDIFDYGPRFRTVETIFKYANQPKVSLGKVIVSSDVVVSPGSSTVVTLSENLTNQSKPLIELKGHKFLQGNLVSSQIYKTTKKQTGSWGINQIAVSERYPGCKSRPCNTDDLYLSAVEAYNTPTFASKLFLLPIINNSSFGELILDDSQNYNTNDYHLFKSISVEALW